MAYDQTTVERVRRGLSGRRDLAERKMMGAICFMVGGHMCCGVMSSALMIRVGRDAYEQVLSEQHVRPMEIGGKRVTGFVLVESAGFETQDTLATWIERGLKFVSTLPRKASA